MPSGVAVADVVGALDAADDPEPLFEQWSATSVTLLTWRALVFAAVEAFELDIALLEFVSVELGVDALLVLLAELASWPETSTSWPTFPPRLSTLPVR
ncbi:MAG: hypothetical protein DMG80_00590 [Acidobacteria bacterium]|nr:MAG: hypothetical protein DMG80_00590 [Acidobacteriota bacterium]